SAYIDGFYVGCTHSELGYTKTFKKMFVSLVENAEVVTATENARLYRELQVLRIDREPEKALSEAEGLELAERVSAHADRALLLSDYEYGVIGDAVSRVARDVASGVGRIAVLDPRRDVARFEGLTAVTPNVGELSRFSGIEAERLDDPETLRGAAVALRRRLDLRHLLVTRGNLGAVLFDDGAPEGLWVEASGTGEVTDVSGAGDTVAAVFTAALAAGAPAPEALVCANAAAGVVVMESGAVACSLEDLSAALEGAPWPAEAPRPEPQRKDVEA
ncbi:MAG: PfkB family carbohydrate kinase, partial [Planctomycetota bacterium]